MAPTTIVSKKTPVTPLPTKPRQQNQVDLNSHQNQQNLQHQPLQNLSQQNHSLTNASDSSGVQVNIKCLILMQTFPSKVEKILKVGLDLIPSPSPLMKIQIWAGKFA